ncbi:MAG: alpha/beta hydrolase family protein [Gemmatimonadaceae bacterium]
MRRVSSRALLAFTLLLTGLACAAPPAAREPRRPFDDAPSAARADRAASERQTVAPPSDSAVEAFFARQVMRKRYVDALFAAALGSEMVVRKVGYPAPDGLTIPAYFFSPRDTASPRPVVLFIHGGVHGDFGLGHLEQVRDLVQRGYVIVAPEYRGSTGYGRRFYDAIDYGGREVDDVIAARDFLAREVPWADLQRTAVMGYSHGGYIALFAVIRRPELFRAAVAHVPVADLPARMRTHPEWYQALFAAQPPYGGTLEENPRPYIERSPSSHARSLRRPVLVHVADNDQDVFIVENRILRDSMVAAGKDTAGLYTYREWRDPPGGHSFGMLDTPQGRESWRETLAFLARHLAPTRRSFSGSGTR